MLEELLACTGDRCNGRRHGVCVEQPGPDKTLLERAVQRAIRGGQQPEGTYPTT